MAIEKKILYPRFIKEVKADMTLHAPHLHWSHSGWFDSLDHGSVRFVGTLKICAYF